MANPWMKCLTLASASTNYNLYALIKALDSKVPETVQGVQIQFDIDAGAARLRIGNSDLSDVNFGVLSFGTQALTRVTVYGMKALPLHDIWLRCDVPGLCVSVVVKLV